VLLTKGRHIPFTSFSFRRCGSYAVSGTNYSLLTLPCHPIKVTFAAFNRWDAASTLRVQSDVLLLHCGQSSLIFLQQSARKVLLLDVHIVARRMSCEYQVLKRIVLWNSYWVCLFVCCRTSIVLKKDLTTVWSGKLTRIKFNCVVLEMKVFHVLVEKYEVEIRLGKILRKWRGILLQVLIFEQIPSQHSGNYTYQAT
jgi:hypothetical protein